MGERVGRVELVYLTTDQFLQHNLATCVLICSIGAIEVKESISGVGAGQGWSCIPPV
ncbi:hypothetical protein [Leptolyngbya sp. FACHB-671]|uniref:hypothetical protein n=1 Tax=Leptolyngbya sp. FACHB-671 TaxID=2692812 RepID=UPI0018F04A72|nr:hypothetical protein [Leptolyngbya sp. FACHB-671]